MLKEKWSKTKNYLISKTQEIFQEVYAEIEVWEIKKITSKKILNICIFLAGLGMGVYFRWGIMNTFIFCIFIGIILKPVSSRILVFPALFFLILAPFALIFKKDIIAENFAIYAYYFLIMATIMGIYEIRENENGDKDEKI